jgi:hypothetical protein
MKFTRRMLGAWLAGLPFLRVAKAKVPTYRITGYTCIYACGCKASGPTPLPSYCPEHGIIERA